VIREIENIAAYVDSSLDPTLYILYIYNYKEQDVALPTFGRASALVSGNCAICVNNILITLWSPAAICILGFVYVLYAYVVPLRLFYVLFIFNRVDAPHSYVISCFPHRLRHQRVRPQAAFAA